MSENKAPHNSEAERAVLGAMIKDQQCLFAMLEQFKDNDFYIPVNRKILAETGIHGRRCKGSGRRILLVERERKK